MTATDNKDKRPACFGVLDRVFPMGKNGLRESPAECMACALKTECLREAVRSGSGLALMEEKTDRAYQSGSISFFERWSRKKLIYRKKKEQK